MSREPLSTVEACVALFHHFFGDVESALKALAPQGWEKSSLLRIFHPSPQQQYEESLRLHRNIEKFTGKSQKKSKTREPKLSDFQKQKTETEIRPLAEFINLLGISLWDIFSDNHKVVSADGRVYELGSFRGSGHFIADYLNEFVVETERSYDYLDFYMGTIWVSGRANLIPVYKWIFRQLKSQDCDWIYHFPRMYLMDFRKSKEEDDAETDLLEYDPGNALARELEQKQEEEASEKFRKTMDEIYEREKEEAKYKPLPETVQAYKNVYGKLPGGWPHG